MAIVKSTHSISRFEAGVCSGLILHFDELSVLSMSKEAVLFTPI